MRTILASVLLLMALACGARADDAAARHFTLENGLKVWLRPVAGAPDIALGVVYDVGEDHDPDRKSGLAHMVEHLYVTCGAGETAPRTADEMMAAYPRRWNAQTGSRYTIIAFLFPPTDLEKEVKDAASRMGALRLTEPEVEREQGRMLEEVSNMFSGFPALVALNRARTRVRPSPLQGRKGGMPDDIQGLTLDDVKAHYERYYKPKNARLVVAGGFDPQKVRPLIEKHFGALPSGEALPAPHSAGEPRLGEIELTRAQGTPKGFPGHLCVAYPAPAPGSDAYPAFLLLVARCFAAAGRGGLPGQVMAQFMILDDPEVLYVTGPAKPGEDPAAAEARIRKTIRDTAAAPLTAAERRQGPQFFAHLLGTITLPDAMLRAASYQLAFGIARRDQLGIDGAKLADALQGVDDETYQKVVADVLDESHSAAVAVRARP